jgi:monofunctional biosynthetic peptidoglycan transglycosylase
VLPARRSRGPAARLLALLDPRRSALKLARLALAGFVLGHVLLAVVVMSSSLVLLKTDPRHTALMAWRRLTAGVRSEAIRFTPLAQIPRPARDMVVRLEDGHFWTHPGVRLGAIRDAYRINRDIGYALYGGSTITQQLARNLYLTPRKTYFRKYVEALTALSMEVVLPKARILELYLNVIEWGKGTFGITAAAARYYGVRPSALGLDQQRRLVAVLPNPVRYSPFTLLGSRQLAQRYQYLVGRFPDAAPVVPADTAADVPPPPAGEPAEDPDGDVPAAGPVTADQPAAEPSAVASPAAGPAPAAAPTAEPATP